MRSLAVYGLVADLLLGRATTSARRRRAFEADARLWARILGLEGCAVQFGHALRAAGLASEAPVWLRDDLRQAIAAALRDGMRAERQLTEIAALAARHGVRVVALKGAARLLAGEMAGTRSFGDIDILVSSPHAAWFHGLMQSELAYSVSGSDAVHHLAGLSRAESLGVEVHFRLSDQALALDAGIWHGTRTVTLGAHPIEIPSPQNMLFHALEHAVGVNWAERYRLRDILDVAALCTEEVSAAATVSFVNASPIRRPLRTILAAAHERESRVPSFGWPLAESATVRRVARARLVLAAVPRGRIAAQRFYSYAGVVAEGSPRGILRLGRRLLAPSLCVAAGLLTDGCRESTRPTAATVPALVVSSESAGVRGIYLVRNDSVARLSPPGEDDWEPQSAAEHIVFTSSRDGNPEIYIARLDLTDQRRITTDPSNDGEPALDPSGTRVAFVSNRSGTPRLWLMDTSGANPRPLDTGSPDFVPEGDPAWGPSGEIAFISTRTNTAQVFVVAATGGPALQITHEAGGAFAPAWSANGASLLYMSLSGPPSIRQVPAAGGDATPFASLAQGIGEPACVSTMCVGVANPLGADASIVAITSAGGVARTLGLGLANARHPAFLVVFPPASSSSSP